ncbi:ScbA/BarX family gamma-butyrolactone biosynthesis protein [Streptomyces sp. B-S-A8]|uniref:ScbA/BarX family gamma-butyrolactone biosynthesis protein n=1 Tax=Streptomyces solicavernae TaxID=3043614 RepID=A0ABT6S137_9ACTN|nr:ScbA/BarX family gamma-butyrolactone biosynthesis protein [Streptomyces sp. B-S-A8]MDI3390402.1 ScbA/BarX family gamma-butyrolactone biosynthesis protein [Streptomyces sp. B-S-A8]
MQTHAFAVHEPSGNVEVHSRSSIGTPGITLPTAPGSPAFTTTVPREFVHRAAVAEVLLTGWTAVQEREEEPDAFVVRAQWPRGHCLFAQAGGYQDPMLLIESVRQIGALLAHAEYGVPFGHQFLLRDLSFTAVPDLFRATPTPTEVELHTCCREVTRRGGNLTGMRYEVRVEVAGVPLATASAAFTCIAPNVYRRLRKGRPTGADRAAGAPLDPATVGRSGAEHVVLTDDGGAAAGRGSWGLRIDSTHPIFFDHPVDHVPGMVLLEAARQSAYAATGRPDALITGLSSTFTNYAELDAPCRVEAVTGASAAGETPVQITGVQGGRSLFTAGITLTTPTR